MKRQIRPYFKHAVRENILYLVLIVLLVVFTVGFVFIAPRILSENNQKLTQLNSDVKDLRLKQSILSSSTSGSSVDVEQSVIVMNKLIPDAEDFFSIISALERLSERTGFTITSYDVDLQKSGSNKLSLNVSGVGDEQGFINFLQKYNFEGERLITIEDISLGEKEIGSFNLILNFYNQKSSDVEDKNLDYQGALQTAKSIRDKVTFSLQSTQDPTQFEIDYQKKSNPF